MLFQVLHALIVYECTVCLVQISNTLDGAIWWMILYVIEFRGLPVPRPDNTVVHCHEIDFTTQGKIQEHGIYVLIPFHSHSQYMAAGNREKETLANCSLYLVPKDPYQSMIRRYVHVQGLSPVFIAGRVGVGVLCLDGSCLRLLVMWEDGSCLLSRAQRTGIATAERGCCTSCCG